jgi:hypothetical protein
MTIAALYVDPRGPYPTMADVDCWDAARDAMLYAGPHPIVAHPPCGPWSKLRHLYRGNEHACAPKAVDQVRTFGGVLEHPAHSKLWDVIDLPKPGQVDSLGGYTIEVDQVDWGHLARKKTWLYLVRVPRSALLEPPFPGRAPTHWCSGFRASKRRYPAHYKRQGCAVPPGIKVCSAQQRRRTPRAFAEYLIHLARSVQ